MITDTDKVEIIITTTKLIYLMIMNGIPNNSNSKLALLLLSKITDTTNDNTTELLRKELDALAVEMEYGS